MTVSTFPNASQTTPSAQARRVKLHLLDLLVCLALATSTLRWFTVISFGNVSVEPVHVALVFVFLYFCVSTRRLNEAASIISYAPYFWALYVAYLLLSFVFLL